MDALALLESLNPADRAEYERRFPEFVRRLRRYGNAQRRSSGGRSTTTHDGRNTGTESGSQGRQEPEHSIDGTHQPRNASPVLVDGHDSAAHTGTNSIDVNPPNGPLAGADASPRLKRYLERIGRVQQAQNDRRNVRTAAAARAAPDPAPTSPGDSSGPNDETRKPTTQLANTENRSWKAKLRRLMRILRRPRGEGNLVNQ